MALFAGPGVASALAGEHFFSGSFGSAGEGAGQLELAAPVINGEGQVTAGGSGVAVNDETGDVYVADTGNHRVDEFESDGTFVRAWGWGVGGGVGFEVCTAAGLGCKAGMSGFEPGEFETPTFIAVDNSTEPGDPSKGDVYVGDTGDNLVTKFTSEGALEGSWGTGGQLAGGECEKAKEDFPCSESKVLPFGSLAGIAVSPTGDLYVNHPVESHGEVFTFTQSGGFDLSPFEASFGVGPDGLGVDATGDVYAAARTNGVFQYEHSGENVPHVFATGGSVTGFAVDPVNDDVYLDDGGASIDHWALNGLEERSPPPNDSFGSLGELEAGAGLAVDSTEETVYAADTGHGRIDVFSHVGPVPRTDAATGVTGTSATLDAQVVPTGGEPVEECEFEYVQAAKYHASAPDPYSEGATVACSPPPPYSSTTAVSAEVTGLSLSTVYDYRVSAKDTRAQSSGADETLRTKGLEISSQHSTDVTESAATLAAVIDPFGEPASYRFEYLTEAAFLANGDSFSGPQPAASAPQPEAPIGEGDEGVPVSAHVQGLSPNTVYRYRVVGIDAVSAPGGIDGPTLALTTRGTGEFKLPDGREWEMVSPPQKNGALIEQLNAHGSQGPSGAVRAAADGGAITYLAGTATESEPAGAANRIQVFSVRGAGGWSSRDISSPHVGETTLGIGDGQEYRFFSEDLSRGVLQPFGPFIACESTEGAKQPCLSGEASEQTAFLRSDFAGGAAAGEPCTSSCYTPFVTGKAGYANVPLGTVFGVGDTSNVGNLECAPGANVYCGPEFVGASPDSRHVVLRSSVALKAGTPTPDGALYEWNAGRPASEQLALVSLLPPNGNEEELPAGSAVLGAAPGANEADARDAVSEDGSRVFWSSQSTNARGLYMRDTARSRTLQIGGASAEYQTASSDGTRVFFTEGGDLFECAIGEEAGQLECDPPADKATDLTPGGEVLGSVPGASEDGSWVYFVANGKLAEHAVQGNCPFNTPAVPDTVCDLYVRHGGETRLVAVLSGEDVPDWARQLNLVTARVSPNGQWLAFMSQRSLTGYDNLDAASGMLDEEVFLYHAETSPSGSLEPGKLMCASCDPTGARPRGVEYGSAQGLFVDGGRWESNNWLAGNVPAWTQYTNHTAVYQSRYLSDSGRLFFNSSDALVPKDVNGTVNVYEYEPEGVPAGEHACTSSSSSGSEVFKPGQTVTLEQNTPQEHTVQEGAGCVALISSGESAQESAFLEASETGSDVFFLTTSRLAPQDTDDAYDVYDAQECTAEVPCPPQPASSPAPCNTEASCKAAPSPQPEIFGPTGSATFSGPGNPPPPPPAMVIKPLTRAQKLAKALKACRTKHNKHKRQACEKAAHHKYGATKAKKASDDRRAGR